MKLVFASDVHNKWGKVDWPDGDILVVAGDLTMMGRPEEIGKAGAYLASLTYKHKVVIAGNHDWLFQKDWKKAVELLGHGKDGIIYLEDSYLLLKEEGIKFYGAPWQPEFCNWAFNLPRGPALAEKWAKIPDGVDVLITHGPPAGILDTVAGGPPLGCADLRKAVERVWPKYHVFGHIHDSHGHKMINGTEFVNASVCNERYEAVNKPIVRDI